MKNKKYWRVYIHTVKKNQKKYIGLSTEFKNAAEAGKSIGKGRSLIVKCCNGKCKMAYKFIFKYEC